MSNYRRKLRSSTKTVPVSDDEDEEDDIKKEEDEEIYQLYQRPNDPPSPRTPPAQSIEPYFPPSPFGRKRHQPHGDRFIPTRDRNLARDFQMMDNSPSNSNSSSNIKRSNTESSNNNTNNTTATTSETPTINRETRRFSAFFRAEVLDDPSAVDEYVSPDSPARTQRRVLHYTQSNISNNTPIPSSSNATTAASNSATAAAAATPQTTHNTQSVANITSISNNTSTTTTANNHNHNISTISNNINNLSSSIFNNTSTTTITTAYINNHYTNSYSPEPTESIYNNSTNNSIPPVLSPSPTFQHAEYVDSPSASRFQTSPIGEAGRRILLSSDRYSRQINTTAIKILDAPELQDDFYLNLVDWGTNDCLAVGLGSCVYLWNANTSRVTKLCDFVTDTVTSVNWSHMGSLLAVGTNTGRAILYDAEHSKRVRTWSSHSSRIGSMAWRSNILTTGGRDHAIYHHDVRSPESHFRKLTGHTQEICGLKWNPEGTMLASGGNDNNLLVWDSHENVIAHRFSQHTAAVKAISWNPHKRGVLVSGGGTADKTIKFWNTISGQLTSSHDTGSQVCNIAWSKKTDDIVSTHGYANNAVSSSNQVIVWKADKMQRIATLTGHTCRVLYMAMSNDGSTVVTGAGDETLRFWDIFSSVEGIRSDPEDRRSCLR